ncbi:MAG TPA: hypothetical protein DCQ29_01780, partial [Chitinophagaceae bacterium]|nr:hypothetical protein [Chitinophagaceae bacterium]
VGLVVRENRGEREDGSEQEGEEERGALGHGRQFSGNAAQGKRADIARCDQANPWCDECALAVAENFCGITRGTLCKSFRP